MKLHCVVIIVMLTIVVVVVLCYGGFSNESLGHEAKETVSFYYAISERYLICVAIAGKHNVARSERGVDIPWH